ncbi:aldose 1-epimerase [Patulibacter sp.]|uniref:aldose 1-epimerase n=1 Tax=Patulibacter sp. TaxID=1912859 RepID=UPI00271E89FF|nr:aldose 1-epimerase [Patulibacter sp.]MDO9409863.1 aldose 1-epimerase [Patulibacter sp.]
MTELRAGPLTAVWRPDVGMVGSSLTHEGEELLGQRGGLDAYRAKGSAFGIPLLAPWANRLSGLTYPSSHGQVVLDPERVKLDGNGLPKDGAMAGREWVVEHESGDWLVASFEADEPVLAVFPFPHALRVSVRLSPDTMEVTTSLTATGDVAVPRCFGWHPLFTLPGVAREHLDVTLPVVRESTLDDRGIPTGRVHPPHWTDGPLGDRTLDAEYPVIDGAFVLRGGGRRLTVRFGSPEFPVGHAWAPEGESFVAWEPMTAPTNALVTGDGLEFVAPGATTSSTFVVEVVADRR